MSRLTDLLRRRSAPVPGPVGTRLGTDDGFRAVVDARASIHPSGTSHRVEWWIGGEDRWYAPAVEAAVRQDRPGPAPVLVTRMRVAGGDVVATTWATLASGSSGAAVVVDGANAFDTTGYTDSADAAPTGCTNAFGNNASDGWYSWTAGACTTVTIDTCDASSFDTDLAMYDGGCGALNLLACDGDGGDAAGCQGFDSKLTDVPVTAGTTYLIRVGGWNALDFGTGTLTITID